VQVLPSLVINALSLLYSLSQLVTVAWCVPTHDEVDEQSPLLQHGRDDVDHARSAVDDALRVESDADAAGPASAV
jgi:hypothetical protein